MRRRQRGQGLEGSSDLTFLLVCGLALTTFLVSALARDHQLPPIALPEAAVSQLGESEEAEVTVTLRPTDTDEASVFIEDQPLAGGMEALPERLRASGARVMVLRADGDVSWKDCVAAMGVASSLGLEISAAVKP